jgi:hypothetical protein
MRSVEQHAAPGQLLKVVRAQAGQDAYRDVPLAGSLVDPLSRVYVVALACGAAGLTVSAIGASSLALVTTATA